MIKLRDEKSRGIKSKGSALSIYYLISTAAWRCGSWDGPFCVLWLVIAKPNASLGTQPNATLCLGHLQCLFCTMSGKEVRVIGGEE